MNSSEISIPRYSDTFSEFRSISSFSSDIEVPEKERGPISPPHISFMRNVVHFNPSFTLSISVSFSNRAEASVVIPRSLLPFLTTTGENFALSIRIEEVVSSTS